jgi:hypothetical protein
MTSADRARTTNASGAVADATIVVVKNERTAQLATHLFVHEPKMSRNRHFAAFEDARFSQALALNRRLRALLAAWERALQEGGRVVVDSGASQGRAAVRILIVSARCKQASLLLETEWRVFLAHPRAQACLAASSPE